MLDAVGGDPLGGKPGEFVRVRRHQDQRMPVAGEFMGKLEPDAAGAAGDERGFVHGRSFAGPVPCGSPSDHAMVAAMVCLTLGILPAPDPAEEAGARLFRDHFHAHHPAGGNRRVYLGVHWPTDVVAGWMLGGAWALLFWLVAMRLDPPAPARP